jgi:hypothetical protein
MPPFYIERKRKMPKNSEIVETITETATVMGVDIPETKGQNNAQLGATLKALREGKVGEAAKELVDAEALAKKEKEEADEADAKADEEATAAAEAEEAEKRPEFYIAGGKSVTCIKGSLAPGDEIKADWLGGGLDSLRSLVKSGIVKEG